MEQGLKLLKFVSSSYRDLKDLPQPVRRFFGFALDQAQRGRKHLDAKPLKGFGGAGVIEIVDYYDGDTYRGVYTVKFAGIIYVLHAFKKKSKSGIATPKQEIDLIRRRLKEAELDYLEQKVSAPKETKR